MTRVAQASRLQPTPPGVPPFKAAGPGDIDGNHLDFSNADHTHGRVNNFVFNRAFNVDMILFRNIVTAVSSAWYVKPSLRFRPTGRKTGGGDDTGFEILGSVMLTVPGYGLLPAVEAIPHARRGYEAAREAESE